MKKVVLFILSLGMCGCILALPEAKVSVEVIDEAGHRLDGCNIAVTFEGQDGEILKTGVSNTNSLFEAQSLVTEPTVSVLVTKVGYYESRSSYMFKARNADKTRMEPWNPVQTLVMRKQQDVVSNMRCEFVDLRSVPVVGKPIGFDLEKNDWVQPYGKGVIGDFVFTIEKEGSWITSYTISFTNEGDGIQKYEFPKGITSVYKWPYEAPISRYNVELKKVTRSNTNVWEQKAYSVQRNADVNYLFRVRSKLDKDGNVISAMYGRVTGEIKLYSKGNIQFYYCVNTDTKSRSLEGVLP